MKWRSATRFSRKAGVRNITSFNGRPAKKTQKELDE